MSISLVRVDDRLIHGQVVTSWVAHSRATRIIVVDDGTFNDKTMSLVCKKLAPDGTTVDVYDIKASIEPLKKYVQAESVKCLILVRTPVTILALVENGVDIKEFIIGGMGKYGTRTKLFRNICADERERACIKKLDEMGCKGYIRIIPTDKPVDASKLV